MHIKKILKSFGSIALGVLIAQLVAVLPSHAQESTGVPPGEGGGCVCIIDPGYVCDYNGQVYEGVRGVCN